jgi:NADPH:quinone reductase-like Zn-dependent oxidoreductase
VTDGPAGLDRQIRAMALSPFVGQRLGTPWFIVDENSADLDALRRMIEAREVRPAISSVVALRDVPRAIRDLVAGNVQGKVVITP